MADKVTNQIPMAQPNQNMAQVPVVAQNKNPQDKNTLFAVLQLLRKYNLKETEELLKKEANLEHGASEETPQSDSEVSSVLSAYKSEGDPEAYEGAYADLKKFVEGALDIYKHELGMILYPVFVHMYLELVYNNHEEQAVRFMGKFGLDQDDYYQDDLKRLSHVTKKDHMKGNELTDTFKYFMTQAEAKHGMFRDEQITLHATLFGQERTNFSLNQEMRL